MLNPEQLKSVVKAVRNNGKPHSYNKSLDVATQSLNLGTYSQYIERLQFSSPFTVYLEKFTSQLYDHFHSNYLEEVFFEYDLLEDFVDENMEEMKRTIAGRLKRSGEDVSERAVNNEMHHINYILASLLSISHLISYIDYSIHNILNPDLLHFNDQKGRPLNQEVRNVCTESLMRLENLTKFLSKLPITEQVDYSDGVDMSYWIRTFAKWIIEQDVNYVVNTVYDDHKKPSDILHSFSRENFNEDLQSELIVLNHFFHESLDLFFGDSMHEKQYMIYDNAESVESLKGDECKVVRKVCKQMICDRQKRYWACRFIELLQVSRQPDNSNNDNSYMCSLGNVQYGKLSDFD